MRQCLITIIAAAVAAACFAQTEEPSHVSIGRAELRAWRGLDTIVPVLDPTRLRPVTAGSWEARNLEPTLRASRVAFSIDLGNPDGFYTTESPAGDILVVEWHNTDPLRPYRAVWLWDDFRSITFIFVTDPSFLQPDTLAPFCEKTVRWRGNGGIVKSLELATLPSGEIVGKPVHDMNEIGALAWWLSGAAVRGTGFVAIGMTKAFFGPTVYPLGTIWVKERFPPLSSRLKTLGRADLFDELGKGYKAPAVITYSGQRDQIVIEEILSRGPMSEPEIARIVLSDAGLAGRLDMTVDLRLQALLASLKRAGVTEQYVPELESFFLSPEAKGLRDQHASTLLGGLERAGIDPTGTALRLLHREPYARICLYVLKWNGHGEEAARELSETPVPSGFQQDKELAIEAIRNRLAAK